MMDPIGLIAKAREQMLALDEAYTDLPLFESVRNQLDYLSSLADGTSGDRTKLSRVIVGVQAAREIEPLDLELAMTLHEIQGWADQLLRSGE